MKSKFEVTAIRTKSQYLFYLKKVDELMDLDPTVESPDGKLLETLTILIDHFEREQGWEIPLVRKLKRKSLAVKSNSLKVSKDFESHT
jgi:antitoxin component HigA of HigAB toxin-antitoxin module